MGRYSLSIHTHIDRQPRMKALKWITDKDLYWSVNYVVFLIDVGDIPLKHALEYAVKHKEYPVKKHIERLVRQAYPKDFFINRAKKAFIKRMTKEELDQWINSKRESQRLENEYNQIVENA